MNRNPRSPWPIVMILIGVLLIAGAAVWYLYASNLQSETPVTGAAGGEDLSAIPRVDLAEAKTAFDTGSAVFVDVRDAEAYAQSHIPGALSIPLNELPNRMGELNPDEWIITY